jgi:hypothetical protein
MAVHENDRRTQRDYIRNACTRYNGANTGSRSVGINVGLALIAFIGYLLLSSASDPGTMGDAVRQTP